MKRITAVDVPGLYCDDITFCYNDCDLIKCPRNSKNIRDTSIPHSYSMDMPADCPKANAKEVSDSKAEERNETAAKEKVIEGLKAMLREFFGLGLPSQPPVFEADQNILTEALALQKEFAEFAEPDQAEHIVFGTNRKCSNCGKYLFPAGKFCPHCGRLVKWE